MFYLNGTQVDEPAGWSGVYWARTRHPDYFGIWRQKTAKVMGVGEVAFTGEARHILRSLWERHGANASTIFEVKDNGGIYQAEVDYGIWSDNGRYFSVGFRDENMELDSLSSMVVTIEPQVQIRFPEQTISDGISYNIADGMLSPFYVSSTQHSIPFATSKNGEGNGLSVGTQSVVEPIYRNSTDRNAILTLEGQVNGIWNGSGEVSFVAEITQDGVVKDTRDLYITNAAPGQQKIYLSGRIEIPQGAYLRVTVKASAGLNVSYSADSFLNIYENSDSESSLVWGLTWKQAIDALLLKLTNGSVTLSSDFLTKGDGAKRVITSERNLRGYRSPLLLSFKALFDDFNAIDNLACWKVADKLFIETKLGMIRKLPRSRVTEYEKLEHTASPFFASSYTVGYSNWQSGTAAGRDEFCTERSYLTGQRKIKATRAIQVANLSASGKTMEVLRRNPSAEKADSNQDEKLFVIEAIKSDSIYVAVTGSVADVLNPENVINGNLSPRNILKRWSSVLGVNGKADFSSGSGNFMAVVNGERENSGVDPAGITQIFSDRSVLIETGMTMRQYSEMGEVVEYFDHDGTLKAALTMDDSYRFTTGKVSINAIELSDEFI